MQLFCRLFKFTQLAAHPVAGSQIADRRRSGQSLNGQTLTSLSGSFAAAPMHRSILAPHLKKSGAIIHSGSVNPAPRVTRL